MEGFYLEGEEGGLAKIPWAEKSYYAPLIIILKTIHFLFRSNFLFFFFFFFENANTYEIIYAGCSNKQMKLKQNTVHLI